MVMSTPSYTAQPMAELKIFRDMRRVEPAKKPATPRCYSKEVVSSGLLMIVFTLRTCQTAHMVLNTPRYLVSERTCIFVLRTSNGWVARVARAPADAAETEFTAVESENGTATNPEFGADDTAEAIGCLVSHSLASHMERQAYRAWI